MLPMCQRASEASGIKKEAETPWGGMSLACLKECPQKIMSKFKGFTQFKFLHISFLICSMLFTICL